MESTDQVLRYKKLRGFATTHGQDFEMHLTALLFLRGVNSARDFQLACNVQGAGYLDDIVFRLKTMDEPVTWHTMFLTSKFKMKATVGRNMLTSPNGDFSLPQYFKSYLEIKETMSAKERYALFQGAFEKCTFVIFTNAKANDNLGSARCNKFSQVEEFLRLEWGNVFSFTEDEDVVECLGGGEGQMFLHSLRMFCGQPSGDALKMAIRNELCKMGIETLHDIDVGRLVKHYLDNVKVWREEGTRILHKNHEILRSAVRKARLENTSQTLPEELDIGRGEGSERKFPGTLRESVSTKHGTAGREMEFTEKYKRNMGFATTQGQDFHMHLTALLFLRGLNRGWDFQLATSVEGAGCLDDLVFRYKTLEEPNTWRAIFLQFKFKNRSIINRKFLTNPSGNFSLSKYFKSYLVIKQAMSTQERDTLFDGEFEKCTFVIFTNAKSGEHLGAERCKNFSQVEEFLWSGSGSVFSLEGNQEMLDCLGECGDEGKMFLNGLRFFCGQPSGSALEEAIRDQLRKMDVKKNHESHVERLAEYFLDNLKIWLANSNEILHKNHTVFRSALGRAKLETSSRKTLEEYKLGFYFEPFAILPLESEVDSGNSMISIESSESSCRLSLTKVVQVFQTRTYTLVFNLQSLLDNEEVITYKWPGTNCATVIIVLDKIVDNEEQFFLLRKKIHEISTGSQLVIVANKDNLEVILKLSSEDHHSIPFITMCCDTFDFSQIHRHWISSLKNVQLQEIPTSFTSLLFGNRKGLEKIDLSLVEEMINANIISRSFGPPLGVVDSDHVTDTIEHRNILKFSLFRETALSESVIVILPTIEHVRSILLEADPTLTPQEVENALCEFTWSHLAPDVTSQSQLLGHDFVLGKFNCKFVGFSKKPPVADADSKSKCANTCKEWQPLDSGFFFIEKEMIKEISKDHQTMHLFELRNGELLWKRSTGSTDLVRRHLNRKRVSLLYPNTVIDITARISVIYGENGKGQALVDRLASRTKSQFPSLWVIAIPSTGYSELFNKEPCTNATKFLLAAANIKLGLEEALFVSALEISGQVAVILSCLGEIDPMEEQRFFDFLTSLRETKAKRICIVTESQDLKVKLENILKTIAMELRKTSDGKADNATD